MSCWTILEINPTKDLKEIKKAYSRLIECYNIEKDTNEYTILTNAYVKAMSLVNTSVKDMSKCLSNNSMDYTYENIKSYCDDSLDNKNYISDFNYRLNYIYTNPTLRFSIDSWVELLKSYMFINKDLLSILEKDLINYIFIHRYIPHEIFLLFDKYLKFNQRESELYEKYPKNMVDFLLQEINHPLNLSYNYLSTISKDKIEEYLELREKAFIYSSDKNVIEYLSKAYSIYAYDLDLLRLLGTYYLNKNDNLMALSYFREAININDNDLYSLAKLGHLLTINKQYDKAIIYLEKYLKRLKNSIDLESLIDLAHAYHYSYELQKAKSLYNFLFKLRPWDLSIKLALENINSKLLTDLSPKPLIPATYQKYINSFLKPLNLKLHEIYNNFSFRLQEDKWNELFSLPIASNESLFYLFEETIITFITTNKNMPKNIYEFLSKNFNWNLRNNELLSIYPNLKIDILFNKLYSNESLSYESLKNIKINNLENYIELRSLAYNSICSNSNNSEKYLNDALKLFNGDFELYKLYGQYYSNNKDYNSAIENYKIALSLKEDDYYSICTLALLLTKVENYKDAIFYLNKSVNTQAGKLLLDNEDFLIKYAISFYYIGNLINAKKYFKKLLLLNPNLKFVNIYLKNINDRLAHKKTPILPISVIEDPDCYTNSLHYTTKGRITNIISKFKQGLILKK